MRDDWLDGELKRSLGARPTHPAPEFDAVMEAAERSISGKRIRYPMVAAAVVLAMAAIALLGRWQVSLDPVEDKFLIAAAMLDNTLWTAPSDSLLPQHRFDIYRELPAFVESTELEEGTLL